MTISVGNFVMFLAIVQLGLAAIAAPRVWRWQWFAGGMLFWAASLFVSATMH